LLVGDAHNMTVSWHRRAARISSAAGEVNSMVVVLLIAGIGLLLAGLLTVAFGIELDLSLGNTLILTGAITACTGLAMVGFWMVVRELKNIAQRLGPDIAVETRRGNKPALAAPAVAAADQPPQDAGFSAGERPADADLAAPPWHEQAATRDRARAEPTAAPEPVEPAVKPRRNLLFSSTSRKERERAQARTEPSAADINPAAAAAPAAAEPAEVPPVTFDDAWPKSERMRPADAAPRRGARAPSTFTEPVPAEPAPDRSPQPVRTETPPEVTVLKSGVVDGMAYSLYSDGSIEAQMPEGMMRFASIDELRAHLDQRP
jgi:hypothetical protein